MHTLRCFRALRKIAAGAEYGDIHAQENLSEIPNERVAWKGTDGNVAYLTPAEAKNRGYTERIYDVNTYENRREQQAKKTMARPVVTPSGGRIYLPTEAEREAYRKNAQQLATRSKNRQNTDEIYDTATAQNKTDFVQQNLPLTLRDFNANKALLGGEFREAQRTGDDITANPEKYPMLNAAWKRYNAPPQTHEQNHQVQAPAATPTQTKGATWTNLKKDVGKVVSGLKKQFNRVMADVSQPKYTASGTSQETSPSPEINADRAEAHAPQPTVSSTEKESRPEVVTPVVDAVPTTPIAPMSNRDTDEGSGMGGEPSGSTASIPPLAAPRRIPQNWDVHPYPDYMRPDYKALSGFWPSYLNFLWGKRPLYRAPVRKVRPDFKSWWDILQRYKY